MLTLLKDPPPARKCFVITLEDPRNGLRNPQDINCNPDYAPYAVHIFPDMMSQFSFEMNFRDLQGFANHPVDRSQLRGGLVSLRSYRAVAHFTRRLVIPEIRLDDWSRTPAALRTG